MKSSVSISPNLFDNQEMEIRDDQNNLVGSYKKLPSGEIEATDWKKMKYPFQKVEIAIISMLRIFQFRQIPTIQINSQQITLFH